MPHQDEDPSNYTDGKDEGFGVPKRRFVRSAGGCEDPSCRRAGWYSEVCDRPGCTNEVHICCPFCAGNLCSFHAGNLQNYTLQELDALTVVHPTFVPSLCHQHDFHAGHHDEPAPPRRRPLMVN